MSEADRTECIFWEDSDADLEHCSRWSENWWLNYESDLCFAALVSKTKPPDGSAAGSWHGPMCARCARGQLAMMLEQEAEWWARWNRIERWDWFRAHYDYVGIWDEDARIPTGPEDILRLMERGGLAVLDKLLESERKIHRRPIESLEEAPKSLLGG